MLYMYTLTIIYLLQLKLSDSCAIAQCRRDVAPYSYLNSNRQASLVLFHADWAHTAPGPMAPHMLAVGAITAAAAKPLPAELEEFVQSAGEHGVVFASLGTTAIPGACTKCLAEKQIGEESVAQSVLHGPLVFLCRTVLTAMVCWPVWLCGSVQSCSITLVVAILS